MSDKEEQVEEEKQTEEAQINTKEGGPPQDIDLEDANNMDEQVYNERNDVVEDSAEQEFQCVNPQNRGGHIVYTCKGID